jgi:DNA-binding CsgD family transcriptional regulator
MSVKASPIDARPVNGGIDVVELEPSQADVLSDARRWAANEVGTAMVHDIGGPLTALLSYLQQVERDSGLADASGAASLPLRQALQKAVQKTQQVHATMERLAGRFDATVAGRDAVALSNGKAVADAGRPPPPPIVDRSALTAREREVLGLVSGGASNKEGAYQLQISTRTFEAHRAQIMRKLGARNAADLVRMTLIGIR